MSLRLFIYYCAMSGGGGAFIGWMIGRFLTGTSGDALIAGVKGLWLGLGVTMALSIVDCIWGAGGRQFVLMALRILVALVVGCLGGFLGGFIGQLLYATAGGMSAFLIFGWTFTGLLIGASLGVFDLLLSLLQNQDSRQAMSKIIKGAIGGTAGGILGSILYLILQVAWKNLLSGKPPDQLWSPSSWGFVALGACIGLLIGLAQVILKEAWLKVEQGFRKGRELILSKPEITLGRGESCDIGLFGDGTIEKIHARILHKGNDYLLVDTGTPGGTYVNEERVAVPRKLRSGDVIRLGKSLIRFGERAKQK